MKKIFGYIFLVLGIFLSLALLGSLPKSLADILGKSQTGTPYNTGYIAGVLFGMFFLALIAFLLIRFGLKWISKKKASREIHDIGQQ